VVGAGPHHTPGHGPQLEERFVQRGHTEGGGPLAVTRGVHIAIAVRFTAPAHPQRDTYTAALTIHSSAWDPIRVPLSVFVAHTIVTPGAAPRARQGETAHLAVSIHNAAGPDTDAQIDLGATAGITMPVQTVHVARGQTRPTTLPLTIAADAPTGRATLELYESAYGGRQRDLVRPQVVLDVHHGAVTAALIHASAAARQSSTLRCQVRAALHGSATELRFTLGTLPHGIAAGASPLPRLALATAASGTVDLPIRLAPDAALGAHPIEIHWTAYAGDRDEQRGTLRLALTVLPGVVTVTSRPPGSLSVVEGQAGEWPLRLAARGSAITVRIAPVSLPPGIAMIAQDFAIPAASSIDRALRFTAAASAPAGSTMLTVRWSTPGDDQSGTLTAPLVIKVPPPRIAYFLASPGNGQVDAGTPVTLSWQIDSVGPTAVTVHGVGPGGPGIFRNNLPTIGSLTDAPPPGATVYTLTATNMGGPTMSSLTVHENLRADEFYYRVESSLTCMTIQVIALDEPSARAEAQREYPQYAVTQITVDQFIAGC
jgi:hypothetical protein